MRFKLTIVAALMSALLVFAACQSAATSPKNETAKNTAATATKTEDHESADDAPRISLEDAKKAFDDGSATFVDTRAEVSYRQEHIKGAINVPMEAVETKYKDIPTTKKIIAYCS